MTLREILKLTVKSKIKLTRLLELKKYYLSLYRCYMIMLYDKGYISDPTRYDESQIIQNLIELGIPDIFDIVGRVDISYDHIKFALYKNYRDTEKRDFLNILLNVLKYRSYVLKIDQIYEEFEFKSKGDTAIKNEMIPKGAKIAQSTRIPYDEAFGRCLSTFETETKSESINNIIWGLAMQELGIPQRDWYLSGLFDKKLAHSHEVECLEGILNGDFKVTDGKYSSLIEKWLSDHKWNKDSRIKADVKGLYDFLFTKYISEIENGIVAKVNEILGRPNTVSILAVDGGKIFYNVRRKTLKVPYGVFSILCDIDTVERFFPQCNNVMGYTGELYPEKRLIDDEIGYAGCPIIMYVDMQHFYLYYDLEQVGITTPTWFTCTEGVDISFDPYNKGIRNTYSSGSLKHRILNGYNASLKNVKNLVMDLNVENVKTKEIETAFKDVMNTVFVYTGGE